MLIFDLETEGIAPEAGDKIRCFAALKLETGDAIVRVAGTGGEEQLIRDIVSVLATDATLCGWNIEEFDLPFIRDRGAVYGIDFPLAEVAGDGKYGNVRYQVPGVETRDIAYELKPVAEALEADWHLQTLAQAFGWQGSTELMGIDMPGAPIAQVVAHCLDDLDAIAFLLREREQRLVDEQSDYLLGNLD